MDLVDRLQAIQQVVQVLQLGAAYLGVQIPAEHRGGIDHVIGDGRGRSVGHLGGDAVVHAVLAGQALVVGVDLGLELHDVPALRQLVADIAHKARVQQVGEVLLVHDDQVAQVARLGAGGEHLVAHDLGRDDVQFDVEAVLDDLGKPAGLGAVVVGRRVVDVDDQRRFLSHRAEQAHGKHHGQHQQDRHKPFHDIPPLIV